MIIPVRCFTCGKVLADKWEAYKRMCEEAGARAEEAGDELDEAPAAPGAKTPHGLVLDKLGITRMCCRAVMLTHVDLSLVI